MLLRLLMNGEWCLWTGGSDPEGSYSGYVKVYLCFWKIQLKYVGVKGHNVYNLLKGFRKK